MQFIYFDRGFNDGVTECERMSGKGNAYAQKRVSLGQCQIVYLNTDRIFWSTEICFILNLNNNFHD